ncbi:MAG: helix-turn-helix transcriptional regulator [Eggerthellaceae bacterium]|nr:helix-turn-helix transcriptional regulator [Eggerthellaceae bacterium]
MSFTTVLNACCSDLGCTGKVIAQRCGISASALSRYRRGERVPDADSDIIDKIASGLASLGAEQGLESYGSKSEIADRLIAELRDSRKVEESFCRHLDELMRVLSIRNSQMAQSVGVDPSYMSRLRNGQRYPANARQFAMKCAEAVAVHRSDESSLDMLTALVGSEIQSAYALPAKLRQTALREIIERWLIGKNEGVMQSGYLDSFLYRVATFDYAVFLKCLDYEHLTLPEMVVSEKEGKIGIGISGMHELEFEFFDATAARAAEGEQVDAYLMADMPILTVSTDASFLEKYSRGIATMLKYGVKLRVFHDLERPFSDMLLDLDNWVPLYMSGLVEGYAIPGIHSSAVAQLRYMSSVCALTSEAVASNFEDSATFLSYEPQEVNARLKTMQNLASHATPLLRVYREDRSSQAAEYALLKAELEASGIRRVFDAGKTRQIDIVVYDNNCAVVTKLSEPVTHFVIRHPRVCYAFDR